MPHSITDTIIETVGGRKENLVEILQALQDKAGYLPEEALRRIADTTEISAADIEEVSSFYTQFRRKPSGKHRIRVCIGTACHVKGAQNIFDAFRKYLEISASEDTDRERMFTIEKVACLGCCMLAPAVQIDNVIYGFVDSGKIPSVLNDFLMSERIPDEDLAPGSAKIAFSGEIGICLCSSCSAAGTHKIHEEISRTIKTLGLPCKLKLTGCSGDSYLAPALGISDAQGQSFRYAKVAADNIAEILTSHFSITSGTAKLANKITTKLKLLLADDIGETPTRYPADIRMPICGDHEYVKPQIHVVTELPGKMNPLDIEEYMANGGFVALKKAVNEMTAEKVTDEIEESGLRGRGGAGYPTGKKWRNVAGAPGTEKYLICNADEGDPGAFMDRMILESFPFRVIEGMLIASFAVGAQCGIIYVRNEYPLAVSRMRKALETCESRGIIGKSIMGSGHSFSLKIIRGAGAFVCGEETALIKAIEGKRGAPSYRPPYPSECGFREKPTLINNVETFASVPWIIRNGADKFSSLGTEKSRGTKTFAVAGKIARGGLIEVPMGITLREITDKIGGGTGDERKIKAVQVGGPSGGCIPEKMLDIPVDYEALTSAGVIMGSGGIIVLDESDCMVDIARYFLSFTRLESCGKCTFCRVGTAQMLSIVENFCAGKAVKGDIEKLEDLAEKVKRGSLCGLGRTAPNPILSTIRYFRDEYEAHIQGICPALKCKDLIMYEIGDECIGCTLCARNCCDEAIISEPYKKHEIDMKKCTRCGTCVKVCRRNAIKVVSKPRNDKEIRPIGQI